tara:strand:- start:10595 stop:10999 length:405 start_codon:yes stop_codon:yes gene_type:complete
MKTMGLDGNEFNITLTGLASKSTLNNKSSLHLEAREIIKNVYPTLQVLEEVTIHLRKSETLYMDFFIPLNKKCIEVHGEQHYEFTPFYHRTKLDFLKQQKRDRDKKEWCEINNIIYIELPYNKQEEWLEIINNA